jgi:hypothetical protein
MSKFDENIGCEETPESFASMTDAERAEFDAWCDECDQDWEDDGQPDEYTEWQDYMDGDDWDHGQYDDYEF